MTADREDIARRATAAFEHAASRLAERRVSDVEIGQAMVAAGLSRWSRAVSGQQLVDELAKPTGGIGDAAGVNLADRSASGSNEFIESKHSSLPDA